MRVFYAEANYGEEEIESVVDVLRNQRHSLMTASKVNELEISVANIFGHSYGVMVNSGSSANLIAIQALDLPLGSQIITPALTFATTLAPIVQSGHIPVLIDCAPDTYCVDIGELENVITSKTKALMIPNLIGNLANWPKIKELAEKNNLVVIEDSADTIGATVNGNKTGKYSDISTTSFYASHIVTGAGFGGMVTTSNDNYVNNLKLLRGWGRNSSLISDSENINLRTNAFLDNIQYDSKFIFSRLGFNFLPSEISAAFALVQLNKLSDNIAKRLNNFQKLLSIFSKYPELFRLPKPLEGSVSPWLAFPFTLQDNLPFTRSELQVHFENNGIQTRTVFSGNALKHPAFSAINAVVNKNGYPESDRVMRNGMLIGCHNGLTAEHLAFVEDKLEEFVLKF
jgi:CDP-6-deoxy-D-xylo-4-hexulose-3-dehydrase